VSEQPNRYRVTFYCDRCVRREGHKRILAVAERGPHPHWHPDLWDQWRLSIARRTPRRVSPERARIGPVKSYSGGAVPDHPQHFAPKPGRFQLVPLHPFDTATQLICRHCKARPREAVAKLVELAEQTVAAGRRDAYV
jgi:hypothetical protein